MTRQKAFCKSQVVAVFASAGLVLGGVGISAQAANNEASPQAPSSAATTQDIKQKWGNLTDDDLTVAEGNSEHLAGKVQERYGIARDEADKQVKEFHDSL